MYKPNKDDSLYVELNRLNPEKYPYTLKELEEQKVIRQKCYEQFLKLKEITATLFKGESK